MVVPCVADQLPEILIVILAELCAVEVVEHLQLGINQVGEVLDGIEHSIHHLGEVLHVLLALTQLGGQYP